MGGCVSGNSPTEDIEIKNGDMKRTKKKDKKGGDAPTSFRSLTSATTDDEQVEQARKIQAQFDELNKHYAKPK